MTGFIGSDLSSSYIIKAYLSLIYYIIISMGPYKIINPIIVWISYKTGLYWSLKGLL